MSDPTDLDLDLDARAEQINSRLRLAEERSIAVALLLAAVKARFGPRDGAGFKAWCRTLTLGETRIRELLRLARTLDARGKLKN